MEIQKLVSERKRVLQQKKQQLKNKDRKTLRLKGELQSVRQQLIGPRQEQHHPKNSGKEVQQRQQPEGGRR